MLLMDVCNEWCAENGKPQNQIARLYTIALSGLREIHMDFNGIIKIVQLTINSNDTVDLPNDFLRYTKIGILGADGRIHSLNVDSSISLNPVYNACGQQIQIPNVNSSGGFPVFGDGFAGVFAGAFFGVAGFPGLNGGVFGIGGGNSSIGYYRLDRATNQLWLANMNAHLGRNLILEYVADVNTDSSGEDFEVHPFIVETIKYWISWKYVIGDRNTPTGEKMMRRNEYYNSYRISNNRYSACLPEEWASTLRKTNVAAPRF